MSVRPLVRVLALALAVAVSWSLWAECALAAASTPNAQMACCKDGEFTCASHGSAADCCATDHARPRAALTTARINPVHTLVAVVAWAVVPELAALDSTPILTDQPISFPRLNSGPPPYIAFSSLLI
jgi:hypothetical protein